MLSSYKGLLFFYLKKCGLTFLQYSWILLFYFRDLAVNRRRPVVVWIHGGNFARGSAAEYEPDYILDEDVVLVTIQYR